MGACGQSLLTTGYSVAICPSVTAGVYEQQIWLANFEDISTWTQTINNDEFSAITFVAGTPTNGLYRIKLDKDGPIWKEEYDPETKSYYHEISGKIPSLDLQARNFLDSLRGPDLVVIARLKADVFKVLGKEGGCKLFTHAGSSEGADVGNTFSLRAQKQGEPCAHFYATSPTLTVAALVGYQVTS